MPKEVNIAKGMPRIRLWRAPRPGRRTCATCRRYLRVVDRLSDLIIRGGKNISAAAVEEEVSTHPSVALAAAVAMPDQVLGERVCVYGEIRPGTSLTLDDLTAHLAERGVSREWHPVS